MSKVRMEFRRFDGDANDRHELTVFVDGEEVGSGYYGGEPEDNSRCRDYGWVEDVLAKVARKLGAEVESIEKEELP